MEIRESSLIFPQTEGDGPQSASATIAFTRAVLRVAIGVTGYSAVFEDNDDHHVGRLEVELDAAVNSDDTTTVDVSGVFGLRDWSNEFDDPYSGIVDFVLLAELEPAPTPLPGDPRSDLVVTGAEVTQVVQHFRSNLHLDAANVFPDNSVRLVGDKPTMVRLYPDYDKSSGLPVINWLSGELVVESGGTVTTLSPLESITPRRDVSTDRRLRSHTLNFRLPEELCRGTVILRARVFDLFDPDQFSGTFEREIVFEDRAPLEVLAVGIKYTGDDVKTDAPEEDLAAPVESDFVDTLAFTELTYPIPHFTITSYEEMEYDEDVESDINEGCDKMGDLRDAVAELRGDSDDIVYGMYNVGVETGSVGGCGGSGVGVGRIGAQSTAAHEIGHAVGRKHAPCDNVTRCAQPLNTDGSYPDYAGYDSDSIGEYGFDTRGAVGAVRDPAMFHDFMGYSPNDWISPYTYKGLLAALPAASPAAAPVAALSTTAALPDGEWIRLKQETLYVRLDIPADGEAILHPSFHFQVRPRPTDGDPTRYTLGVLDGEGAVLGTTCLVARAEGCDCNGRRSGTLRIRQPVRLPAGARRLVLSKCDEPVAEWAIPAPAEVGLEVVCEGDEIVARWTAKRHRGERGALWALLQWQDRLGTWRGLVPRTRDREIRLPRSRFGGGQFTLRVLVTGGIATGSAVWTGECDPGDPDLRYQPTRVTVVGTTSAAPGVTNLGGSLRATVLGGRDVPQSGSMRWYGGDGAELGRGRSLDVGALPVGRHSVTVAVVGSSVRVQPAQVHIERTIDGRLLLLVGDLHPLREPCEPEEEQDGERRHHGDHIHDKDREEN